MKNFLSLIAAKANKNWPTVMAAVTAAIGAFLAGVGVPPDLAAGGAATIMTALVAVAHRLEAPK